MCWSFSTVYLQEFQIRLICAGLYQPYMHMSFIYDRFVPVFFKHYVCKGPKYNSDLPVIINSIFARVSNMIDLCRSLPTTYLQEFQIRKRFTGLYQQYICKSLNTVDFCRSLSTVHLQEFQISLRCVRLYQQICNYNKFVSVFINCIFRRVSKKIEFCRSLSTVYLLEFQIQ